MAELSPTATATEVQPLATGRAGAAHRHAVGVVQPEIRPDELLQQRQGLRVVDQAVEVRAPVQELEP